MLIMKKFLKILLIIVLALVILVGVIIFVANNALRSAAKLEAYDFGSDKIPSLTSIVGERKVTGVSTSASASTSAGSVQQKHYAYETQTLGDDFTAYHNALHEAGLLVTVSKEGDDLIGSIQYGYDSADEGKIILMDVSWDNGKIAVDLTKSEGTITPY